MNRLLRKAIPVQGFKQTQRIIIKGMNLRYADAKPFDGFRFLAVALDIGFAVVVSQNLGKVFDVLAMEYQVVIYEVTHLDILRQHHRTPEIGFCFH